MKNKILIFRTDRIGDLLFTSPVILSLKKKINNNSIYLVASEKNYDYAISLNFFDNVYKYPKKGLIKKIKFIYKMHKKKFDFIFVFDGKERSIFSTLFIKSKYKVAIIQKINPFYKFFKIKYIEDKIGENLHDKYAEALAYCKINNSIDSFNVLKNKKNNNLDKEIYVNKYIHIHLDEKWINELYIKGLTLINPEYPEFIDFVTTLSKINNVLITTGIVEFKLLNDLKINFFTKKTNKIYIQKNTNNPIFFIYKPSFEDIESILHKSEVLISCHGAVTHASNSFNIKKIDIIEKSKSRFYKRFTGYLKLYKPIYRENFSSLKTKLLKTINE
jgi:hypothetical protein